MKKLLLCLCLMSLAVAGYPQGKSVDFLLGGLTALSGNLSGAQVYTYSAGTTTPKSLYTTRALTTALDNPLTLDIDGRYSSAFGSGVYKFVVKDAYGNTIFTADNIEVSSLQAILDYPVDPFGDTLTQTNLIVEDLTLDSGAVASLTVTNLTLTSDPPLATNSAGVAGTITFDENYLYICASTSVWFRIASGTW